MHSKIAKCAFLVGLAAIAYFSLVLIDVSCNEGLSFCKLYEPLTPF